MSKGDQMEELLRNYFLDLGYFVIRGAKYKYENNDITDVDLFLYGRASSITRHRINVDIKNKKTPQAFERVLWANGLKQLLMFDKCIVATTDKRQVVHNFGKKHSTTILDGNFLSRIKSNTYPNRYSEEEILDLFSKYSGLNFNLNVKDWKSIVEASKSSLLSELDFSSFNLNLLRAKYFIITMLSDVNKKEDANRALYIIISHLLITMDYILKDIVFLESSERERALDEGLKYGNLGKEGVDKVISMAVKISGDKSIKNISKSMESFPIDILKEFFIKNDNNKNLFIWAKKFESLAYEKNFVSITKIADSSLQGFIYLLLDCFNIDRKSL